MSAMGERYQDVLDRIEACENEQETEALYVELRDGGELVPTFANRLDERIAFLRGEREWESQWRTKSA
jgi:hypothetical protein